MAHLLFSRFRPLTINIKFKNTVSVYTSHRYLKSALGFEIKFKRTVCASSLGLFAYLCCQMSWLIRYELGFTSEGVRIKTKRQKTGGTLNVPLLEVPWKIIQKHNPYFDELESMDPVLPIMSNQKMNAYLKEIADLAGISKSLSYHIARHTFATTVTMLNGVPIESVSKMLGHKNIKSTQHYARIIDQKVSNDMKVLSSKIDGKMVVNWG